MAPTTTLGPGRTATAAKPPQPPNRHRKRCLSASAADQAPAFPVPDLRARRPHLPRPLGAAAAALHELPARPRLRTRRDADGAQRGARRRSPARDLERLLPLLLRLGRIGASRPRRAD